MSTSVRVLRQTWAVGSCGVLVISSRSSDAVMMMLLVVVIANAVARVMLCWRLRVSEVDYMRSTIATTRRIITIIVVVASRHVASSVRRLAASHEQQRERAPMLAGPACVPLLPALQKYFDF